MRSPILVLPLTLLSTSSIVAARTFEDYFGDYLPSCMVNCTVRGIEDVSNCSRGSGASSDEADIACLCDIVLSTDTDVAVDVAEAMVDCVTDASCSTSELQEFEGVDPEESVKEAEKMCADSGGSSGAGVLSAGSNFALVVGVLVALAVF
ncbi:hypothetical protein BJX76DRAFT_359221 [Aspergillus varians]